MSFSRKEHSLTDGRANQRARTRAALVDAAGQLIRENRAPAMQEAADRALVSLATAYRYFRTAEDLWAEAVAYNAQDFLDTAQLERDIAAAGDDVEARLTVLVQGLGFAIIDNPMFARQSAKTSLDRWFAQQGTADEDEPTRPGQRNKWNSLVLEPLRGQLEDYQVDAIVEGLAFVIGSEPTITLLDVLRLSPEAAKERLLTTALWILRSGLADAKASSRKRKK